MAHGQGRVIQGMSLSLMQLGTDRGSAIQPQARLVPALGSNIAAGTHLIPRHVAAVAGGLGPAQRDAGGGGVPHKGCIRGRPGWHRGLQKSTPGLSSVFQSWVDGHAACTQHPTADMQHACCPAQACAAAAPACRRRPAGSMRSRPAAQEAASRAAGVIGSSGAQLRQCHRQQRTLAHLLPCQPASLPCPPPRN